jgi:inner membrane transporter RhtA
MFLPVLAVLGSIVSLTVGTSYGKALFETIGAGGTAAYRVVFAAIILMCVWRPWRFAVTAADRWAIVRYGITIGVMNFFFYQAINRLPLGIAIAIEFTGPLAVAVLSSRRVLDFVWVALTVLGLVLILPLQQTPPPTICPHPISTGILSLPPCGLDPLGVVFAFVAALMWAWYIVFGKRVSHLHGGAVAAWGMMAGSVVIVPLAAWESGARLWAPHLIPAALVLAVASSAVPYTLEMFALKRLPKNTFSILLSLEPAVGALTGFVVLHEVLSWQQWVAIACIMSASVGAAMKARKPVEIVP